MKGFVNEFKAFLIKGNVMDMAVGFIFGAAFATVVKSLVANIVMPPIGMLMGKVDFSALYIALDGGNYATLKAAEEASAPIIKYGQFINDVIGFVILGFVIFMLIRMVGKLQKKEEEKPKETPADIRLLEEIRDSLAK
ncbi:MAG: large conductance mechanosensitive channel protein MscL [Candidatus Pacebacteria bacterium]|nr:large conductance mechanosensitive channel protein MscL [Candidatus Paceibacterota bacterium]